MLKLITPVSDSIITLEEIKTHLNIEYDDRDDDLEAYHLAAINQIEQDTGRVWLEETWELILPCFPICGKLKIPKPPLKSVTSIKYFDVNGAEQTLDPANYYVMTGNQGEDGYIQAANLVFPPTQPFRPNAVTIRFVCGDSENVNPLFFHLVKLWIGVFWNNREGQEGKDLGAIQRITWSLSHKGYA